MLDTALAAGAAALAVAFCIATWERWLLRRRRHELAWSASFACYAIASFALAIGVAGGWNGLVFRTFYAAGAVATVPILATGTAYLHFGRKTGDVVAAVTVVLVAVGVGVVMASPFVHPLPLDELAQGSKVFNAGPRVFAAVGSGVGATAVIAGSVISALRGRAALANVLIALGVTANGASGLLNSLVGETRGFVVMLAIGITLLFAGFLAATTPQRAVTPPRRLQPQATRP